MSSQDFIIYWGNVKENEDTFIGKGKQIIFYVKYINIISYVNFKKYGIFMKNGPGKPGKWRENEENQIVGTLY